MKFYVRRELDFDGNVMEYVEIGILQSLKDADYLLLSHFKRFFGFTPKKGATYFVSGDASYTIIS